MHTSLSTSQKARIMFAMVDWALKANPVGTLNYFGGGGGVGWGLQFADKWLASWELLNCLTWHRCKMQCWLSVFASGPDCVGHVLPSGVWTHMDVCGIFAPVAVSCSLKVTSSLFSQLTSAMMGQCVFVCLCVYVCMCFVCVCVCVCVCVLACMHVCVIYASLCYMCGWVCVCVKSFDL